APAGPHARGLVSAGGLARGTDRAPELEPAARAAVDHGPARCRWTARAPPRRARARRPGSGHHLEARRHLRAGPEAGDARLRPLSPRALRRGPGGGAGGARPRRTAPAEAGRRAEPDAVRGDAGRPLPGVGRRAARIRWCGASPDDGRGSVPDDGAAPGALAP